MRISDWSSDVCSSDLSREPLTLAPPPAKAGGGWEGVLTVRAESNDTPPQPSPAFAGEGARARGFRRSYESLQKKSGPSSRARLLLRMRGVRPACRAAGQIGRASWRERGGPAV